MNFAMATLGLKEFSHFLQIYGSHSWVLLENAKKILVSIFELVAMPLSLKNLLLKHGDQKSCI